MVAAKARMRNAAWWERANRDGDEWTDVLVLCTCVFVRDGLGGGDGAIGRGREALKHVCRLHWGAAREDGSSGLLGSSSENQDTKEDAARRGSGRRGRAVMDGQHASAPTAGAGGRRRRRAPTHRAPGAAQSRGALAWGGPGGRVHGSRSGSSAAGKSQHQSSNASSVALAAESSVRVIASFMHRRHGTIRCSTADTSHGAHDSGQDGTPLPYERAVGRRCMTGPATIGRRARHHDAGPAYQMLAGLPTVPARGQQSTQSTQREQS